MTALRRPENAAVEHASTVHHPSDRRLGQILVDEFGWDPSVVDLAAREQRADPVDARRQIGHYLRRSRGASADPRRGYEIGLALLLQRQERRPRKQSRLHFDLVEYRELGYLLRFERDDMMRKLRAYALVMVALLLYIAYPLGMTMATAPPAVTRSAGSAGSERVDAVAARTAAVRPIAADGSSSAPRSAPEGPPPALDADRSGLLAEAAPARAPGLFYLYVLIGLFLVAFAAALGDTVVKTYGDFLKRTRRIARARTAIRAAWVESGRATRTTMPWRDPRKSAEQGSRSAERTAPPTERPDPEFRGVHRRLPQYYALWSLLKFALAVFFVACVVERSFVLRWPSLRTAVTAVTMLAPLWLHFLAGTCIRYHKYLREAGLLTPDILYPHMSTDHLRRWQEKRTGLRAATVLVWLSVCGVIVSGLGYFAAGSWNDATERDVLQEWFFLGTSTAFLLHATARVYEVRIRLRSMQPAHDGGT